MADAGASVIGIDLGTTMSAVSVVDQYGKPIILNNSEGDLITPSVVFFESPTNKVVGKSARNAAALDPDLVVEAVKNEMGKDTTWTMHGEVYTPAEISAIILRRLKEDAEAALGGPVAGAVITVPAIFGDAERQATRNAAEIAGLNVVSILEEPVAAAIAYGFGTADSGYEGTMLIYDLGGGTFDITVMRVSGGKFDMLITHGNRRLGGKDWDKALSDHLAEKFLEQIGGEDPRDDLETRVDLLHKSEDGKKDLSRRNGAKITVQSPDGHRLRTEVTREKFDELTADLLEQTRTTLSVALGDLKDNGRLPGGWADIDKILLVGGSSRMPQVAAMLQEESGKVPEMLEVDLVVAQGAALYAVIQTLKKRQEEGADKADEASPIFGLPPDIEEAMGSVEVGRVCSFAIGVAARTGPGKLENVVMVPVNSPLPCYKTMTFGTVENDQPSARLQVYEGDSAKLDLCIPLGSGIITLTRGLPEGTKVDVSIGLTDESSISASAVVPGTGDSVEFTLVRAVEMSAEQIAQARSRLAQDTVE